MEVIAVVQGKPVTELPADLFIPPDALEILLDSFSGPLDLLLYLIRRQNLDILDIPIAPITEQYMHYIRLMEETRLELAADYLVMAAMLAEIKSRLLLPKPASTEEEFEEDPRQELMRKLLIYEQIKLASIALDDLPRCERDHFRLNLNNQHIPRMHCPPEVKLDFLLDAMTEVLKRCSHKVHHQINLEPLSVRDRMHTVLNYLQRHKQIELGQLWTRQEGRRGLVVSLLAILELARQSLLILTQVKPFSLIHLQAIDHD